MWGSGRACSSAGAGVFGGGVLRGGTGFFGVL